MSKTKYSGSFQNILAVLEFFILTAPGTSVSVAYTKVEPNFDALHSITNLIFIIGIYSLTYEIL